MMIQVEKDSRAKVSAGEREGERDDRERVR
jgi:hypothetical protein